MSNRNFLLRPYSNPQMEQLMMCDLLPVANCSSDFQRFDAMNLWSNIFPNLTWTGPVTLTGYLDRIIRSAMNYKPKYEYVEASFEVLFRRNFKVETFNDIVLRIEYPIDENMSNISLTLFKSRLLRIDMQIVWSQYNSYELIIIMNLFQANSNTSLLTQRIDSNFIRTTKSG